MTGHYSGDSTAEDTTVELSKIGGWYGGTYDSQITIDTTSEPNNKPRITLCTVHNLISITFIRMN